MPAITHDTDDWIEIEEAQPAEPLPPGVRRHIMGNKNGSPVVCSCWRCRGGSLPVREMAALDRITARALLRMPEAQRETWMGAFLLHPRHSASAASALERWMAIESGRQLAAPVYLADVGAVSVPADPSEAGADE